MSDTTGLLTPPAPQKAPLRDPARGKAIAAVAACALLWSTGGLFIKVIDWNPLAIAGVRSLIGGLLILAYLRRPRFTWSFAQVAAAVLYSATMVGFVAANKLTTAANAILLQYTAPVYAAILGWIFLGERASWLDWVTIGVVLGGMVLFFLDRLSVGGMAGNLLAIATGVTFAGAMVFLRKQKGGSPLESILLSHGLTFLVSIPFLWRGSPSLVGWGALGLLGLFQVGLSSIFLAYGVRHVTALQSLLIAVIEPLFSPLWVFLAVGEVPGPFAVAGGVIILLMVTARSVASALRPASSSRRARRR
jgi:drug/metabolite transporter (DMT)-like permease